MENKHSTLNRNPEGSENYYYIFITVAVKQKRRRWGKMGPLGVKCITHFIRKASFITKIGNDSLIFRKKWKTHFTLLKHKFSSCLSSSPLSTKFQVEVVTSSGASAFPEWDRVRLFDKDVMHLFLTQIRSASTAKVTSVVAKEKAKQRPQALNTVELLRVASSALGMSPHHTMQVDYRDISLYALKLCLWVLSFVENCCSECFVVNCPCDFALNILYLS